jgi:hypothetical protein
MPAHQPPPLRWSEEAEAKYVLEWAELEGASPNRAEQTELTSKRPHQLTNLPSLPFWLRIFSRRQNA